MPEVMVQACRSWAPRTPEPRSMCSWTSFRSTPMNGRLHLDFASGRGLPFVGVLLPDSWQRPFEVVTVPETVLHPLTTYPDDA